jgi:RNA polymerase sigma-70 factor (ECF subfamily)
MRVTQKLWEPERMEACVISNERGRPHHAEPVARARAGDLAAFEELYREHAGRVYAICLRMTADPARAEELTQEAFVRAWEKLGSFRGSGEFGGWLRRLVINVVLAERRSRGRRLARETETEDVSRFRRPGEDPHPTSGLDLESAIAKLPPGARRVFVLHDIEGYRHDEIAKMLRVASGTSKTQLHRARKLLREALRS